MERQPLLPRPTFPAGCFHPVPVDIREFRNLGEIRDGGVAADPEVVAVGRQTLTPRGGAGNED